jgi:hypothetical protein
MANTEQDHTGGRPKALLEEGKLSTPHGRRRRGRVGASRLAELGRSELDPHRGAHSGSSDSGSSDDTEDEVKRRRRATARALVSLPHGKSVFVTASNLIRSTARTGDVKLKRPDRCSAAVSIGAFLATRSASYFAHTLPTDREIVLDRAEPRTFAMEHSSQKVAGATVPLRHAQQTRATFRKIFNARLLLLLESTWRLLPRARTPLLLCDGMDAILAHDLVGGVSDSLAAAHHAVHDPEPRKFTQLASLSATLDSCKATCTTSFRLAAYARRLLIGCPLRRMESWEVRVVRVEVAFCSLPREMAVSQHSSRAPPSQRPRSR